MFPNRPRADERLASEDVIWLTTVSPDGQPQTSPVWFIIEHGEFLVYSREDTARRRNLNANPRVALNLDGNGHGGDIVTIEGIARIDPEAPSPADHAAYLAKYQRRMDRNGWSPEWFATQYPLPIRIAFTRGRSW
jgi:PPOX class probable F420-dependent enzyme